MIKKGLLALLLGQWAMQAQAQDSSHFSFHFQSTSVSQRHFKFHSPYQGQNSLVPDEGIASSLTNTLFLAFKPWKNTLLILNPEVSGGRGLSDAQGIAGFPNGEIYRVGDPKPTVYLGRLIVEQRFDLHPTQYVHVPDDVNAVSGDYAVDYLKVFAGRFCLMDYFDNNPYSHDARSQFLNWSIMSAGAYDYAADTRGYTWGLGSEWKKKHWRAALALTMEPLVANELQLDAKV